MDRKGSKSNRTFAYRPEKRKFRGNRYSGNADSGFASTSAEKLRESKDEEIRLNRSISYCILNFCSVFSVLSEPLICKECHQEVLFSEASPQGFGFKVAVECRCGTQYIDSCPKIGKSYEVNRRMVVAMRLLGIGQKGINLFSGIMDIGLGISNHLFYGCLEHFHNAAHIVCQSVLKRAAADETEKNIEHGRPEAEFIVSGDGTWKKRGFSSLFGVSSLIGVLSNKVIDVTTKSKFCQACSIWKKKEGSEEYNKWWCNHEDNCTINHNGSAGQMEVNAISHMFLRSEEKHGVKYNIYVGDGDCKTFRNLVDINPYNGDPTVQKRECVAHVQKRMGTRLRNVKKLKKGLGDKGVGKLTDKLINELSVYYGLAIRRHSDSTDKMREAIWATFYHKSSSNTNPQHQCCPKGVNSWCSWRRAEARDENMGEFKHEKPPLDNKVLEAIRPIYEDLSREELLERCLGAYTQNNNESLNSLIWTFAPKHLHCGKESVEIASYIAVAIFNEGFKPILKMMDVMGISIGQKSYTCAELRDADRIQRSEHRTSAVAKQARMDQVKQRTLLDQHFNDVEGLVYGAGIAD